MLTRHQFDSACKGLLGKYIGSVSVPDCFKDWSWHEHPVRRLLHWSSRLVCLAKAQSVPGFGHLTRTTLHTRRLGSPPLHASFDEILEDDEALNDEATADTSSPPPESLTCRQYIVYSATFQVPAFYFTIHDSSRLPLCRMLLHFTFRQMAALCLWLI